MRNSHYNAALANTSNSFLGSCKRCGSPDLYVKQQSVHLGLFCRDCDLWQKWIRKSDARRYQRKTIVQPKLTLTPWDYPEVVERIGPAVVDPPPDDLAARLEILERKFANYDVELKILVRAILSAGVLQPKPGLPGVVVDDERIAQLGRELAHEEEGR